MPIHEPRPVAPPGQSAPLGPGAFAAATRLTPKALRVYARGGLLVPARTDPRTGYRRYAPAQVARGRLVLVLRRAGLPLVAVRAVADSVDAHDPPAALAALDAFAADEAARGAERRRVLARLRTIVASSAGPRSAGPGAAPYAVVVRDEPERRVLSVCRNVTPAALGGYIAEALAALEREARRQGVRAAGPPFGLYWGEVTAERDGPLELCVPVAGPAEPPPGARYGVLPAARLAVARLTRAESRFPDLLAAYYAVYDHAAALAPGAPPAGPPREFYLAAPDEGGPDDPFLEIGWPVGGP